MFIIIWIHEINPVLLSSNTVLHLNIFTLII